MTYATTLSDSTPPSNITNLSISSCSFSSCSLSWTAPGNDGNIGTASSYDLRYSTSPIDSTNWASTIQATGEPTPTAAGTTQSMVVTGLDPATTYYFAIRTADGSGNVSGLSNLVQGTTTRTPDTTSPTAPVLSLTINSSSQVTLTWTASTDTGGSGLAGYRVYRDSAQIAQVGANTLSYVDSGLSPSAYNYYVVAYDGDNNTTPSNTVIGDTQWPTIISFTATPVSTSQIDLSWVATDNVGVTKMQIYRTTAAPYLPLGPYIYLPGSETSYSDTNGLSANQEVCYTLCAYDAIDHQTCTPGYVCATTLSDSTPPSNITNLSVSSCSSASCSLSWTASTDVGGSELGGYRIYRNGAQVGTAAASATSYTDPGLSPSTSYSYYIIAYDNAGNSSSQSNTVIGATTSAYSGSYDPTTDFSIYNGNPNGVWSYGWMPNDFSTFNLYTGARMDTNYNGSPEWYRYEDNYLYTPNIVRNDDNVSHYNVAPGQLALHPSSTNQPSVLRWTAPSTGLYNFAGRFLSGDLGIMQVGIRQGSNWLWQGVDSGSFNFDRSLTVGQSIDFLVYGGFGAGSTPLELTIVSSSVYVDSDSDGYLSDVDCNDAIPTIHPDATELCNNTDDDCNLQVDETFTNLNTACSVGVGACTRTGNYVCSNDGAGTICDATIGLPTMEIPDGIDNDCDGAVDEAATANLDVLVLADNSGLPLNGALVTLSNDVSTYMTDGSGRIRITTTPGVKTIYAFKDGYKPVAIATDLVSIENSATIRLPLGDVLVIDQVSVTPLSQQEIVNRGVQLTDPANYWVYDFSVALSIGGTPTTIEQSSVIMPSNPTPGTTTTLQPTTVQNSGGGGGGSTIQTTVIALPEGRRAYAFLLIPGEIKLLKEFFEAKVIVKNEATADFVITGTTASLNLPSALVLVPLNGVNQQAATTLGDIAGGSQAEARWVLRGDSEGDHTISVAASGILQPFGITLTASNSGVVKVYGKPALSAVFNAPTGVNAGEEFIFTASVSNTSAINVYGVSMALDTAGMINVHLATGESPEKSIGTLTAAGTPGSVQTVEFRLISDITGIVSVAHSATYSDPYLVASLAIDNCSHLPGEGAPDPISQMAFEDAYKSAGGFTVLGCPRSPDFMVRRAEPSGAEGSMAAGWVQNFEKGHIHLMDGGAAAFATTGFFDELYTYDMEGSASLLGFPVSDQFITPQGYAAQDFEGGYLFTDFGDISNSLDDVTYTEFYAQPSLIKLQNDYHVYYRSGDDLMHHIPDPETFEILRFEWNSITNEPAIGVISDPLPALRTGSAKDGSLIRRRGLYGDGYKVYLIEKGVARHVPDPNTLFAMGRRFDEVFPLERALFDRIPQGAEIPSVDSGAADEGFIDFVSGFGFGSMAGYEGGVNTATGNYTHQKTDLTIPRRGLPFIFSRTYNAKDSYNSMLGPGWTHNYNMEAIETQKQPDGGAVTNVFVSVKWGDGHEEFFQWDAASSSYGAVHGVHNTLAGGSGGETLSVTTKAQVKYTFDRVNAETVGSTDRAGNKTFITTNHYRLRSISDRNGNTITLNYSRLSSALVDPEVLISVTDTVGRTVSFSYDEVSDSTTTKKLYFLRRITDTIGRTIQIDYDQDWRLVASTDPGGGTTHYRYKTNRDTGLPYPLIEEILDPLGNRDVVNQYNEGISTLDYKKAGSTVTGGSAMSVTYELNRTRIKDPFVQETIYSHQNNKLTGIQNPNGDSASVNYDPLNPLDIAMVTDWRNNSTGLINDSGGNVLSATDAMGNVTRFEYDGMNNLIRKTDALGRVTSYDYDTRGNLIRVTAPIGTTEITYNPYGQPVSATDPLGNVTTYDYDADGNLITVNQPLGRTTRYTYDGVGRRISATDANGNTTQFAYDNNNRLITETYSLGYTERYEYDANGNRIAVIDRVGSRTVYDYDARNRLIKVSDASGNTQYGYDELNRLIWQSDGEGKVTRYEYDAVGNLKKVTDADGWTVEYTYDANGNRRSMKEPNDNVTRYEYDALNRLTSSTEPLDNQHRYVYDDVGNMTSMTNANGNTTQYSYDAMDRPSIVTYPSSEMVSFGYDANGNRTQMTDTVGTTRYSYDTLNRLTVYADPFGQAVGYGYDGNGNRASITYPDGRVVRYGYDELNRLTTVQDWLNRTATYSYDTASRLTGTINPNATTTAYSYNNANRLTSLINRKSNSTVISSYSYTLDAVGNHLHSAQTEPLSPAMPDQTTSYTYDAENRLISAGGVNYRFDNNGNLIEKGSDSFGYDNRNKLIQSIISGTATQYRYDGAGNRLAKIEGTKTVRYVLDINSDLPNVLAETDGNGTISAYYVYGLGLISKVLPDGTAFYYHYDSRGSTIALTDAGQNITDAYAYDPFGKVVNSTGLTANPFRYVGRYGLMDEGNGLTYIRARYYAPELGRFITKDSLTGKAGDSQSLNRYLYVQSSPIIAIDPDGFLMTTVENMYWWVASKETKQMEELNYERIKAFNEGDLQRIYEAEKKYKESDEEYFKKALVKTGEIYMDTRMPPPTSSFSVIKDVGKWGLSKAKKIGSPISRGYRFVWDNFTAIKFLNEIYGHPLFDPSTWDSFRRGELPSPLPFGIEFKCRECPQT